MFYYIYNDAKIKVRETAVDTALFKVYVELTDEQREFYIANPTASVREVKRCELYPRPVEPTLDEVKVSAIEELSEYSLMTSEKVVPSYKVHNAQITLLGNIADAIYSTDEAQDIVSKANEVGKECRTLFYESKERIENSYTADDVYDIVAEVRGEYDIIARGHETTI